MNSRRIAAGVLGLADSAFGMYLGYTTPYSSVTGAFLTYLFWLSVILLADSLLCLYGIRYAFLVAALLSVIILTDSAVAPLTDYVHLALLAVSLASTVANVVAFRATSRLSEQAHPMNLPVFG